MFVILIVCIFYFRESNGLEYEPKRPRFDSIKFSSVSTNLKYILPVDSINNLFSYFEFFIIKIMWTAKANLRDVIQRGFRKNDHWIAEWIYFNPVYWGIFETFCNAIWIYNFNWKQSERYCSFKYIRILKVVVCSIVDCYFRQISES